MFIPALFVAVGGAVAGAVTAVGSFVATGLGALGVAHGAAFAIGGAISNAGLALGGTIAALGGAAGIGGFVKAAMTVASIASMVVGTPQISAASGAALDFKADPYAGIPYLIGRGATGGYLVAQRTSNDGKGEYLHNFVALSGAGPIDSFESFTADNTAVFYTGGKANSSSGPYQDVMWSARTLGPISGWSLGQPSGTGTVAEWTSAHKASGYAMDRWILKTDQNAYPSMPKPRWVGKWVKVYDPRLDSTYPGGSGSHRWVDPRVDPAGHAAAKATWTWSENPHIHALNWKLGRWDRDESNSGAAYTLILGLGTPMAGIDVAAFVEAANIADANGWTITGGATSRDSKAEVERAMLQAGGAVPLRKAALQSCLISTPRVSIATLTAADFSGEVGISASVPAREKVNQVTPSFVSEEHNWEIVPAEPVIVDSLVTASGRVRARGVTYPLVNKVNQAAQLALYACYDSYEFGPVTLPLMPRWMHLAAGDVITVHDAAVGFATAQDLLILERTTDPQTGGDVAICRSETTAKHPAALGQSGVAPPIPGVTGVDPRNIPAPAADAWTLIGGSDTIDAAVVPTLHLTGATDNGAASSVVLALSLDGVTPVSSLGEHPPSFTGKNITEGVGPNTDYYVLIAYKVMGVQGAWRAYGPVTTGTAAAPSAGEVPWDGVTNPNGTRPDDNATVGGTVGEDIRDGDGNVLPPGEIITSEGTSNDTANIRGVPTSVWTSSVEASAQAARLNALAAVRNALGAHSDDSYQSPYLFRDGEPVVAYAERTLTKVAGDLAAEVSERESLAAAVTDGETGLAATREHFTDLIADLEAGKASATEFAALQAVVEDGDTGLTATRTQFTSLVADLEEGKASATEFTELKAAVEDEDTGLEATRAHFTEVTADLETGKASVTDFNALAAVVEDGTTGLSATRTEFSELISDLATGKVSVTTFEELAAIFYDPTTGFETKRAQLDVIAGVLADADNLEAFWRVTAAAGADPAFVEVVSRLDGSIFRAVAKEVYLAAVAGGASKAAIKLLDSLVTLYGNVLVEGRIKQAGGGPGYALAMESFKVSVSNNAVVTMTDVFGAPPVVTPALPSVTLEPLAAGEYYDIGTKALSPSAWTAKVEIITPGTSSRVSTTGSATSPGTGPTLQRDKPTTEDAVEDYTFSVSGDAFVTEGIDISIYKDFFLTGRATAWFNDGSGWLEGASTDISGVFYSGSPSGETVPFSVAWEAPAPGPVGQHGGKEFGITVALYDGFGGPLTPTTLTFDSVEYATQTGGTRRSATASGQKQTFVVTPRNTAL